MFAGTETANRAVQMYGFGFFEEKRGFWEARCLLLTTWPERSPPPGLGTELAPAGGSECGNPRKM